MTMQTAIEAAKDIMLGSEPEAMFVIGRTYRTRGVFCRDGDVRHQSATVIGQVNDHMNRLWLIVEYSDGRSGQVLANGTTGLGYPHCSDLLPAVR